MRKMTRGKMATQPYKYIGIELDRTHGLDWYDHGARHYNPVTGRWNVMDALVEKYYPWSPYVSCGDDPVDAVDIDGDSIFYFKLLLSAKTFFEHIKIRAGFLAWNSAILVTFVSCCKFQIK